MVGGFEYFLFSVLIGEEISNLRRFFSDGLKPTTRSSFFEVEVFSLTGKDEEFS